MITSNQHKEIILTGSGASSRWNVSFVECDDAPIKVWQPPCKDIEYVIGVDTSTGLAEDYSVAQVVTRCMPFEQVAIMRVKWSVVDVAPLVAALGHWYNRAQIIVETNYPGNAVQDTLIQDYRYPNNYQAEKRMDENQKITTKFGFQTTQASKWLLIRQLQEVLKDKDLIINCESTIEEMGNFVYMEEGTKTGAAPGFNDDCVMALMLAVHAARLRPQSALIKRIQPASKRDRRLQKQIEDFMERKIRDLTKPKRTIL